MSQSSQSQPESSTQQQPQSPNTGFVREKKAEEAQPEAKTATKPSFVHTLAGLCEKAGLLVLLLLGLLAYWPRLWALLPGKEALATRDLWFGGESQLGALVAEMLDKGQWLVPSLDGIAYTSVMPLYLWFAKSLALWGHLSVPEALWLATTTSAIALLLATWLLARASGFSAASALAAGLLLCASLPLMSFGLLASADFGTALFSCLSLLCLYRGWTSASAPLWLASGFLLCALATLSGGLAGLALPLGTSLLFLLVRLDFRRALAWDGALAFGLLLIFLGGWLILLSLHDGGRDYLNSLLADFRLHMSAWTLQDHLSLAGFAATTWLPWTGLVLFLPWERLPSGCMAFFANRKEKPGSVWYACMFLVALLLLVVWHRPAAPMALFVPLAPVLAIGTAHAVLQLGPKRCLWFWLWVAFCFALCGISQITIFALPFATHYLPAEWFTAVPAQLVEVAGQSRFLWLGGFILLGGSAILVLRSVRIQSKGSLLVASLTSLILLQPVALLLMPSLNTAFSPKSIAQEMADFQQQGLKPLTLGLPLGSLSLYAGGTIQGVSSFDELEARLSSHQPLRVLLPQNLWKIMHDKQPALAGHFEALSQHTMSLQHFVVLQQTKSNSADATEKENTAPESAPLEQQKTIEEKTSPPELLHEDPLYEPQQDATGQEAQILLQPAPEKPDIPKEVPLPLGD